VLPPETSTFTPVTYDASSESKKATTLATSCTEPYRRIGTMPIICAATSSGSAA
jgi:hypothetical protein